MCGLRERRFLTISLGTELMFRSASDPRNTFLEFSKRDLDPLFPNQSVAHYESSNILKASMSYMQARQACGAHVPNNYTD